MRAFLFQSFMTLLTVIDPIAVLPVFFALTKNETVSERRRIAKKCCLISLILLTAFGLGGRSLLSFMGISNGAFQIAGGFLLLLAALDMVISDGQHQNPNPQETKEAAKRDDISVFPLSIPLISGPGSLTSMVVLMQSAEPLGWWAHVGVLSCAMLVILITYLGLLFGGRALNYLGITGTNVLVRVFGIILAALAMQNMISGIQSTLLNNSCCNGSRTNQQQ